MKRKYYQEQFTHSPTYLKKRYKMTKKDVQKLYSKQKGKCAICGIHKRNLKYPFDIDHDHITRKVRGLLCGRCNAGIGFFKENSEILISAANYLIIHKNNS